MSDIESDEVSIPADPSLETPEPPISADASSNVPRVEAEVASESLREAIARLGLSVPEDRIGKLEEYCRVLWKLNERINLTRHTTWDLFAKRDLLDTIRLAEHLAPGEEILDVGTGGGVPGVPLAILRPDLKIHLCDSVGKKARAIDEVVNEIRLPVHVHAARVQDVLEDLTFDTLVTRAAGSIKQLCNWLDSYWHCFNRLLAIKGPKWVDERAEARHRGLLHGLRLRRIAGYNMPGTKSESVILQMERPKPGTAKSKGSPVNDRGDSSSTPADDRQSNLDDLGEE